MKITFEEALSKHDSLCKELLDSVPIEVIDKAKADLFYDVKLLINDVEVEPYFFNKIMSNLDHYIQEVAKAMIKEKLYEAEEKAHQLYKLVEEVSENLRDKYNLHLESDFE